MNKQRDAIYRKRRQVLDSLKDEESRAALKNLILDFIDKEITDIVLSSVDKDGNFNIDIALKEAANIIEVKKEDIEGIGCLPAKALAIAKPCFGGARLAEEGANPPADLDLSCLQKIIHKKYNEREDEIGDDMMRNLEKLVALKIIDMLWMQHLDFMEHLRSSVSLRGFGQRDPLVEYKRDGLEAFHNLLKGIQTQISRNIFKAGFFQAEKSIEQEKKERDNLRYSGGDDSANTSTTIRNANKAGRNDLCPCGSGLKYKRCCGK